MQRYNSSILDDILEQTLKYSGSSISSDELRIGVFFDKELLNMYLMKLAKG